MLITFLETCFRGEDLVEWREQRGLYETSNEVSCNYTPFCFVAKDGDEMTGAVSVLKSWGPKYTLKANR